MNVQRQTGCGIQSCIVFEVVQLVVVLVQLVVAAVRVRLFPEMAPSSPNCHPYTSQGSKRNREAVFAMRSGKQSGTQSGTQVVRKWRAEANKS
jgi:hypothetical protein